MSFFERVDQTIRRSPVWRSLFRNPYPDDERSRAYAVMNNVFLHIHPVRVRQHAVKFAYTFCLGGLSFFLFLVLTVTGVYLMFFYIPSETQAYTNILDIQSRVGFGLLPRNIHRWAAHLMVFFVFLHMMRVFYHGAYKPPREFNWVVGVVLLFLTIMLSFTGYLLPWDQIAYWAITIGTNMGGYAPLFNTPTKFILLGGIEVGQNTLLRFYVLHIMVFPLVAVIFLAVHFWRIRKDGGISGPRSTDECGRCRLCRSLTHIGVRSFACSPAPSPRRLLAFHRSADHDRPEDGDRSGRTAGRILRPMARGSVASAFGERTARAG